MAEYPALPLFTDALLADCHHLEDAALGRYLRLLILMWRSPGCRVPNDDTWLANKLGRSVEIIEKEFRPLIGEFCRTDGNWLWQKRLLKEFKYLTRQRKAQSVRAKLRWEKEKDDARAHAGKMPERSRKNAAPQAAGNAPHPTPPTTSVSKDTGAEAPPSAADDLTKVVFGQGLTWLAKASGKPEAACRPLLGKWRRDYGDEALIGAIAAAQRTAQRDGALLDPVPWLEKALQARTKPDQGGKFNI